MKFGWIVKENYGVLFSNEKWLLGYKLIHKSKQRGSYGMELVWDLIPSARGEVQQKEGRYTLSDGN